MAKSRVASGRPEAWTPPGSNTCGPSLSRRPWGARSPWPALRLPVAIGASVCALAASFALVVGLSSPTGQRAARAGAGDTAAAGISGDNGLAGLQQLLSFLLPPPPPPAPPPAPPAPPPTEAPASVLVADALGAVTVYGSANGSVINHISGTNVVGQREAFLVTDASVPGWYQVELPVKPNGSTGWIQASSVTTRQDTYYIRVHQSEFKLDLFQNGQLQQSFRVAVGAPSTPTPTGNFFVYAAQDWNSAPYAVGIFALSGFSPVLDNWPGGGRAGIHGWIDPSVLGTRASHGCVRMSGPDFARLMHTLPLGTPVEILP